MGNAPPVPLNDPRKPLKMIKPKLMKPPVSKPVFHMHKVTSVPGPMPAKTESPIGTGFMPETDVTIHKKKVQVSHPGGPQNILYETVETTEVRPGKKPAPHRVMVNGKGRMGHQHRIGMRPMIHHKFAG